MTVRDQTGAINKLASIADRKAKVVERIRKELAAAESELNAAMAEWRKAFTLSVPALLESPSPPADAAEADGDAPDVAR